MIQFPTAEREHILTRYKAALDAAMTAIAAGVTLPNLKKRVSQKLTLAGICHVVKQCFEETAKKPEFVDEMQCKMLVFRQMHKLKGAMFLCSVPAAATTLDEYILALERRINFLTHYEKL